MSASVPPVPEGYHSITPYIVVDDAAKAIEFYAAAFDASERMRLPMPDGRLGHAEINIGDSIMMLSDEFPEMGFQGPKAIGGCPTHFLIYIPNVDEAFQKAVEAGCEVVRPVADQFYGDRSGMVKDPFGHVWTLSTHIEDVSMEEIHARMKQSAGEGGDEPSQG